MILLNVLLLTVVVGLSDGQQLAVENAQFSGFIESRGDQAVLLYRQDKFHGELNLDSVRRIDFGYKRGKPFPLAVTMTSGQRLDVESERRDFVILKGMTDAGPILLKHPDPISTTIRISTRKPNRKDDLTITYLEFPAN